jgi:peptidoglycan/LPS O-acetylase OafA/YrhL
MGAGPAGGGATASRERFLALDAFRGLAAIGVAVFHFRWTHKELVATSFFDGAFTLLDCFFVLSGFMLAHVYLAKPTTVRAFVWRRLARLYPLHLFAMLMFLGLQLVKLVASQHGVNTRHEAFESMNILNFLDNILLLQSFGVLAHDVSWNYPSWTVSTELFATLLVYALVMRFGRGALKTICGTLIALTILYMVVFSVQPRDYGPDALIRCILAVALGCLVQRAHANYQVIRGPLWGTVAEVAAVIAIIAMMRSSMAQSVWYLIVIGLAGAVYVFAAEAGLVSRALRTLRVNDLGTVSYSMYLNHVLVGTVFSKFYLVYAPNLGLTGAQSTALFLVLFVTLLVLYSAVTYRLIEIPAREWLMQRGPPRLPAALREAVARGMQALRVSTEPVAIGQAFEARLQRAAGRAPALSGAEGRQPRPRV